MAKKPAPKPPKLNVGTFLLAQRSGLFSYGQSVMLATARPATKPAPTKGKRK